MDEMKWTPLLVEERMEEAADVLARLPDRKVQGHFCNWPPILREYWESFGWQEASMRRPQPSAAAIDRMDETMTWLAWVDPVDAKVIWLRASGHRWKAVCWKTGLARTAANQHWMYGLYVIVWRLNGLELPRNKNRKQLIAAVRKAA